MDEIFYTNLKHWKVGKKKSCERCIGFLGEFSWPFGLAGPARPGTIGPGLIGLIIYLLLTALKYQI